MLGLGGNGAGALSKLDDYLDPNAWEVGWEVKRELQEYKFKLRQP